MIHFAVALDKFHLRDNPSDFQDERGTYIVGLWYIPHVKQSFVATRARPVEHGAVWLGTASFPTREEFFSFYKQKAV